MRPEPSHASDWILIAKDAKGEERARVVIPDPTLVQVDRVDLSSHHIEGGSHQDLQVVWTADLPEDPTLTSVDIQARDVSTGQWVTRSTLKLSSPERQMNGTITISSTASVNPVVVTTLEARGGPANRIDVFVIGARYPEITIGDYREDSDNMLEEIFSRPPFKEYRAAFNLYRVELPNGVELATGSLPTIVSWANLRSTLQGLPWDQLLVATRGMSGGIAYLGMNVAINGGASSAPHEFGHSFGLLMDEYTYPPEFRYDYAYLPTREQDLRVLWSNATQGTQGTPWADLAGNPYPPKWVQWMTPDHPEVGVFQGVAYYRNLFRPTEKSMMSWVGSPFYAVNEEALVKRVHQQVSMVDAAAPLPGSIVLAPFGPGSVRTCRLALLQPLDQTVEVEWFLGNTEVGRGSTFTLDASRLSQFPETLRAVVQDRTPKVRDPLVYYQTASPFNVMAETLAWTVTVASAPPLALEPPIGLTAHSISPVAVPLTWSGLVTVPENAWVVVERRVRDTPFELIATLPVTGTSYTDRAVDPDTPYTYRLEVIAPAGESLPSRVVTVMTPPASQVLFAAISLQADRGKMTPHAKRRLLVQVAKVQALVAQAQAALSLAAVSQDLLQSQISRATALSLLDWVADRMLEGRSTGRRYLPARIPRFLAAQAKRQLMTISCREDLGWIARQLAKSVRKLKPSL